jgi:hypothetical protein
MRRHGFDWAGDFSELLETYYGEGMSGLYKKDETRLWFDGKPQVFAGLARYRSSKTLFEPAFFYVPAQRVLTLRNGWPRPFTDYSPGDPFAVREFSERIRLEFSGSDSLFPKTQRLNKPLRDLLATAYFHKFNLKIEKYRSQKRLVLVSPNAKQTLPFMVWSAGQREFVPLLLSLYWLMPAGSTSQRDQMEWVVIEEPEMGLHPVAISVILLICLELLRRGYKVCLSTHSQHVLDLVWALRLLKHTKADPSVVLDLFGVRKKGEPALLKLAKSVLEKTTKVFAFDTKGQTHDISELDPGSDLHIERTWGGLTEFGGQVSDVVARAVSASETGNRR